jgi:hypothetical protein
MNFSFIHPFKLRRDPANVPPHRPPLHDQSEGSEFLDDAIHYEDVQEIPVYYTKESQKPIDNRQ